MSRFAFVCAFSIALSCLGCTDNDDPPSEPTRPNDGLHMPNRDAGERDTGPNHDADAGDTDGGDVDAGNTDAG
jgi:hypothetical protein